MYMFLFLIGIMKKRMPFHLKNVKRHSLLRQYLNIYVIKGRKCDGMDECDIAGIRIVSVFGDAFKVNFEGEGKSFGR